MLQAMRDKVMGWLGWIVIGLIIVTFALFGLGSYLQDKTRVFAAKVNDVEISQDELQWAYQQQRAELERRLGGQYDPRMFDEAAVRNNALNGLIRRQLVMQAARDNGMVISDQLLAAHIQTNPSLQENGVFSEERYRAVLFQQGRTAAGFEAETRDMLQVQQVVQGLTATVFVTPGEIDRAYRLQEQTRDFAYIVVPAAPAESVTEVGQEQVQEYFDAHGGEFMVPERVRLAYLQLSGEQLGQEIEIEEDELLAYYDDKKASLAESEQRRASHILIEAPAGDEQAVAAAEQKAQQLLDEIRQGADFAALAREHSDDPGSATQGGDLGFFARGAMVPEFDATVFDMETGTVSDPVRTQFGIHIIQLTEVKGSEVPELTEVREQLISELQQAKVDDIYYEQLEQLTDLSYEHPDSLEAAADALGLEIQTSDWLDSRGGEGVGRYPKVVAVAFGEDVLEAGNNSEPVEVGDNSVIVVRVAEREAARPSTLDEVSARIELTLKQQQVVSEARQKGEALLEMLEKGAAIEELDSGEDLELRKAEGVTRTVSEHNPEVVREAFRLSKPEGEAAVNKGFALSSGDYVILRVTRVSEGDPASMENDVRTQLGRGFENMRSSVALSTMVDSLRNRAEIVIPEESE